MASWRVRLISAAFGRVVGDEARLADHAGDRGRDDDGAASLADHVGQGRAHREEGAAHVDVVGRVPRLEGLSQRGAGNQYPGVGVEDVQVPVSGDDIGWWPNGASLRRGLPPVALLPGRTSAGRPGRR